MVKHVSDNADESATSTWRSAVEHSARQLGLLLGSETTVDGGWVGTATTRDDAATTRTSGAR
jgi:hypothetical protein